MIRRTRNVLVMLLVVAAALCAAPGISRAAATEDRCGPLFTPKRLANLEPSAVRRVQNALNQIYADDGDPSRTGGRGRPLAIDGVMGAETQNAVLRFCADLLVDFARADRAAVPDAAVRSFWRIVQGKPLLKKQLLSAELSQWINKQTLARRTEYSTIRVFGSEEQVAWLLQTYEAGSAPVTDAPPSPPPAAAKVPAPTPTPPLTSRGDDSLSFDYYKLTAEKIAALMEVQAKAPAGTPAPGKPTFESILKGLKDVEYPTPGLFDAALRSRSKGTLPDSQVETIRGAAKTTHHGMQQGAVGWDDDGCGCVQRERLPGDYVQADGRRSPGFSYGVFPLWRADQKQLVDFTMLSTVGYFAIPFDDDGKLRDPLDKADPHRLDFVEAARRHDSRVDWIIRRAEWGSLVDLRREKRTVPMFENLVRQIDTMLAESHGGSWRRFLSVVSFGLIPVPRRGDGVTLYFDHYPNDPEALAEFRDFYRNLHDTLRRTVGSADYAVNLLIPDSSLSDGIFACRSLLELMQNGPDGAKQANGKFIVMIAEPAIDAATKMRDRVESCASGEQRSRLLQALVPLIPAGGDQLQNEIAFFDFNFGGVAFWNHPAMVTELAKKTDEKAVTAAGTKTRATLLSPDREASGLEATIDSNVCTIVCPYRWWIRAILELLLLAALVSVAVRWASCRIGAVPAWPLYLGLGIPVAILLLAVLFCDPSAYRVRRGNLLLIAFVAAFSGYVTLNAVRARGKARMP